MSNHNELILAVAKESIPDQLRETGYHVCHDLSFNAVLQRFNPWIGPRHDLELMPDFKQIIPYITVTDSDHVLAYHRTPHGGEERLHGFMSIGFGGHVEFRDVVSKNSKDFADFSTNLESSWRYDIHWHRTIHKCMVRELKEELRPFPIIDMKYHGFLIDNSSDVGSVHLGVAIEVVTRSVFELMRNDLSIGDFVYIKRNELNEYVDKMESWSQLLING